MTIANIPLDKISTSSSVLNRGGESSIVSNISFLKLVNSIKILKTLIHPITVRKIDGDHYEVITGNRRLLAYKNLYNDGELPLYRTIPAAVLDLDDKTSHLYAFHENSYRINPSVIESFEAKVSFVPFLFDKGEAGDAEKNFQLGMDIVSRYIRLLKGFASKESGDKIAEKFESLKEFSGADEPDKVLRMFFSSLGESPRYFWEKRKVFGYDRDVFMLYSHHKISFNLAGNLNLELEKNTPGVRELIVQAIESNNITSNEISYRLGSLVASGKKEKIIVGKDTVDQRISTFRKINKMLKSDDKVFTEDMIEELDKHIGKIQDIIKGAQK